MHGLLCKPSIGHVVMTDFDPDDLEEMSAKFDKIIRSNDAGGFVMEFTIGIKDAEDLVMNWFAALMFGDENAQRRCLQEYGKIMYHLNRALERQNPEWDEEDFTAYEALGYDDLIGDDSDEDEDD